MNPLSNSLVARYQLLAICCTLDHVLIGICTGVTFLCFKFSNAFSTVIFLSRMVSVPFGRRAILHSEKSGVSWVNLYDVTKSICLCVLSGKWMMTVLVSMSSLHLVNILVVVLVGDRLLSDGRVTLKNIWSMVIRCKYDWVSYMRRSISLELIGLYRELPKRVMLKC